jgi:hypothetical protein
VSTTTPLERLFAELWDLFLDAGGLDGPELGDMIERTGLAAWREATEDDVGDSADFAAGDAILGLTAEGQRVVLAARQSGDDEHG